MYGYDYIQGMQAWGAQATMDDVAQEFENWMAGRGLSGRSLNKVTSEDILSLFRKPSGEGLESFWRTVLAYRLFQGRMKAFSNIDDIERMFNQVKIAKIKAKIEKHVLRWWPGAMHCLSNINHSVMQMDGRHWNSWRIMG